MALKFFIGLHQVADAQHFAACCISVNRLRNRQSSVPAAEWMMDSGAFSTIATHGGYPKPPSDYAAQIRRFAYDGRLVAAVAQDYMCEPSMLAKTGLSVAEHQHLTIETYDSLLAEDCAGVYIMPVLQGYEPKDYVQHIVQYGERLKPGAWVGVGSICKRNSNPAAIESVLLAIKQARPDLRLHGFGIKLTALQSGLVRRLLHSADSMAWSFSARMSGRDGNDWREAANFAARVNTQPFQAVLPLW